LNACRFAKGSDVDSNITLALLAAGLEECIAMSFNIVGGSVQVFTQALYEALLLQRVPFHRAAMLARRAMSQAGQRIARFGQAVEFDDSVVPAVYVGRQVEIGVDEERDLTINEHPWDASIAPRFP
jgi:hypothetical protein